MRISSKEWRIFLHNAEQSTDKAVPTLLTLDAGRWSPHKMNHWDRMRNHWWSATIKASGDLQYAIWLDPKPYREGQAGRILDASGDGEKSTVTAITEPASNHPLESPPAWAYSATNYRIELDRFDNVRGTGLGMANGEEWLGGKFQGLEKHMDYLSDLGVTGLIFSPFTRSKDPFGHHPMSEIEIEPHFGSAGDLRQTVTELKRAGYYVLAERPLKMADEQTADLGFDNWPSSYGPNSAISSPVELFRQWVLDNTVPTQDFAEELQFSLDVVAPNEQLFRWNTLTGDYASGDLLPRPKNLYVDSEHALLAWIFLFTFPGMPTIRSGDEIGLTGREYPQNREAMPWNVNREDSKLLSTVKSLIGMRKARQSLQQGEFHQLVADDDKEIYGFERDYQFESTLVFFNRSSQAQTFRMPAGRFSRGLVDLISGTSMSTSTGILTLVLSPRSAVVLAGS